MTKSRGMDLDGHVLTVALKHRAENPRRPNTHGWLAFEVLRRAAGQRLSAAEYARRLFSPDEDIRRLALKIPGVPNAYQDLKHIRCDIYRGNVEVEPSLPREWYAVIRCTASRKARRKPRHDAG